MASDIGFQTLPTEIFNLIIEHANFSSHFPLAQTCKALYSRMASLLEAHQAAHRKYGAASDLSPSTVPDLLDIVFGCKDPSRSIELWHMRYVEFFGSRGRWDDWHSWEVDPLTGLNASAAPATESAPYASGSEAPETENSEASATLPGVRRWKKRVTYYIEEARKRKIIPESGLEYARSSILSGSDAVLKVILISALPYLKVLKYVNADSSSSSNIVSFCKGIEWALDFGVWPPGLLSLQRLAVGVSLSNMESSFGTSVLVRLLQLPNLDEIYLRGMRIDRGDLNFDDSLDSEDEDNLFWHLSDLDESERAREKARILRTRLSLPVRSSSVKHIVLHELIDYDATGDFMIALLKTPKNLESITVCGCEEPLAKTDEMIRVLSQHQSASLQRLLLYSEHEEHETFPTAVYMLSDLKGCNNLKVLNVRWSDISIDARSANSMDILNAEKLVAHFVNAFPPSISVLVIYEDFLCCGETIGDQIDDCQGLNDAIVALIESKRYPCLEAIYLAIDSVDGNVFEPVSEAHFQRAIDAGKQHGIHVHAPTGTERPASHSSYFVTMPNIHEVKSTPGYDPNWVFDHFTGRNKSNQPCYGCGWCDTCRKN
ncbi:unnamed protein product [Clonostachys chloroleuca]|uniref:F-box domain-containing protein n=1 Tax=Clonostachys chloroleuca TaxID=1926264 RepID=A0AA35Q8T0_9HYPO|nr:unnamed protein product [Clonostachys chloroleuca]